MSIMLPVASSCPWPKLFETEASDIPRPTCTGFVPAMLLLGRDAPCTVSESICWNNARPDLNPIVLMFAMLFPITLMLVW